MVQNRRAKGKPLFSAKISRATRSQSKREREAGKAPTAHENSRALETTSIPRWDNEEGVLLVGGIVVLRLERESPNQRALLCAFQTAGWPRRIANPMEPDSQMNNAQRLADAIYGLNRRQPVPIVEFRRDGRGAVLWRLVSEK